MDLFNRWAQRGGLVKHPPVPMHSLRTAPFPWRGAGAGQMWGLPGGAAGQAPGGSRGYLTRDIAIRSFPVRGGDAVVH